MPPQLLFDIAPIDPSKVAHPIEDIRACNPQRGDFEQLSAIIHVDPEKHEVLARKDVRPDEFWVPGHIPGRPLYPGVLMIESAAQVASFYTKRYLKWDGFIGFGGVDEVRFRREVVPGDTLLLLAKLIWQRHRRVQCASQGLVDGQLVFEAKITGVQM
jgi:3-hydroxyacyl-[acyl-carrier-protein] dehydratase